MSIMSKIIRRLLPFIISLAVCLTGPQSACHAEEVQLVETGDFYSASWAFTNEFSVKWRQSYPKEPKYFSPDYSPGIQSKFQSLEKGTSRMVIAPLNSDTESLVLNSKFKIALVLWQVYVVPIGIGLSDDRITLDNREYWYVPNDAVIIPLLMESYHKLFFSEQIRRQLETETHPISDKTKLPSIQTSSDKPGKLWESSDDNISKIDANSFTADSNQEQSDLEASFTTDVLKVNNKRIPTVINEYPSGVLFYEIPGSIEALKDAFHKDMPILEFDPEVLDRFVKKNPWVSVSRIPGSRSESFSFKVALFVNENEDVDFVEKIVDLLNNPPKSYFPKSYLMSNLSLGLTKQIPPLLLHDATLKYFNILH